MDRVQVPDVYVIVFENGALFRFSTWRPVGAAASCRETRRKQACALQGAHLECGSLLPPSFGEACFASRATVPTPKKPQGIRCYRIFETVY
jgi:hypothetical protein